MQANQSIHRHMACMLMYLYVPVVHGCHENTDDNDCKGSDLLVPLAHLLLVYTTVVQVRTGVVTLTHLTFHNTHISHRNTYISQH